MKNKAPNPLKELLLSRDCFKCRSCCKFNLDDYIDAPMFSLTQSNRILKEYSQKNISFEKIGSLYKIVLKPVPGTKGIFVCPLYVNQSGSCLVYHNRPFDCETWPFYIMKDKGRILIALSKDCPSVQGRLSKTSKSLLDYIVTYMIEKAQKQPDLITEYLPKHKIIEDVTKRYYSNKIIYGLGNPGAENNKSRHNCGWIALDHLYNNSKVISPWKEMKSKEFVFSRIIIQDAEVILCKPTRYMNDQGICLTRAIKHFNINSEKNLLVIYDDLELPFGKIKYKQSGSPRGHNGLKSIVNKLKSESFCRLKIGIESRILADKQKGIDFVLDDFTEEELHSLNTDIIEGSLKAVKCWLKE